MKYNFTFIILLFIAIGLNAQDFSKIENKLIEKIENTESEYFDIYIHLVDRVNIYALLEEMRTSRRSADDRARQVVTSLRYKAESTQQDILKALNRKKDFLIAESIKPLWITNAIKLQANKDLIYEISTWESIEKIYTTIEGHTTIEDRIELSCNEDRALTNGIKAINAPALWKLGYTGYGKKAYVMDSGVLHDHPALSTQYAGNFLPFNQAWTGGGTEPFDVGGHGTHVTGTILGLDRQNQDTIGVAFNANWIGAPVQFGNSPPQPHFVRSFVENMQFALDPDNNPETTDDMPDVFNNSWGHNNFTPEFCNPSAFFAEVHLAVEAAGIAMVWSAGNNGDGFMSVTGYMNSNFDLVSSFAVGNVSQTAPFTIAGSSSRGPSQCGGEGSLLIKPEVSAPGINVRSSYLNGGYAQLTGTSMSAPHVSGAVLLLKEAFPYLAGDELLMALYVSAVDLGEPGEDNIYGMGLIDILAAYNHLINEGHNPEPPISNQVDLVLNNVITRKSQICLGSNDLEINFSNNGTDTIFSFIVEYGLEEIPESLNYKEWLGILAPGETKSLSLDSLLLTQSGTFNLQVILRNPNNSEDARFLNNQKQILISISNFEFLTIDSEFIPCLGGEIKITAENISNPNNLIEWFSDLSFSNLLGEGANLTLPTTTSNQTIYAQQSLKGTLGESLDGEINLLYDELENAGLYFNVYEDSRLKSIKVHANNSGLIVLQILDANNTTLLTQVERITNTGINTIELDVLIPAGFNYKLNVVNAKILASVHEGVSFPYLFSDIIEIYGSYDVTNQFYWERYNFFFDWEITKLTCNATQYNIPVNELYNAPEVEIVKSIDTIFLSNSSNIQFSFNSIPHDAVLWDFGNGDTSVESNPIVEYVEEGNYNITLRMQFDSICTVYAYNNIVVIDDRVSSTSSFIDENNLIVYPNPFNDFISLKSKLAGDYEMQITNSLGQNVFSESIYLFKNGGHQISTSSLPPGSYFLSLSTKTSKSVFKIFKL